MEIQQAKVHQDLAEHLPSLRTAIDAAVSAYTTEYDAGTRRIHSKRSIASVIHDHIVHNMAAFAEDRDGVQIIECSKLWLLSFSSGYLVRFKKVGKSKLAAGHRTGQVKKFRNQQALDGIAQSINLDLSYELDDQGRLFAVYLICPAGTSANMWDSEIQSDGARPVVVSLFGTSPPTEPQGATLLPKKGKSNETQSGDGDIGA